MKASTYLLWLLCLPVIVSSQNPEKPMDALMDKVKCLELLGDSLKVKFSEVEAGRIELESKLSNMYLAQLKEMEFAVRDAFDKTDVISISATYQEVIKSIISLHNEITRINNFNDAEKVFGIDFAAQVSLIMENALINGWFADSIAMNECKALEHKKWIKTMIRNVIANPVITGILKSNPVTSVAHSVINQVLMYKQSEMGDIFIDRGGFRLPENYKDFKNSYSFFRTAYHSSKITRKIEENSFSEVSQVEELTRQLEPLILLFDELSGINDKYASSLHVFMKASEQTIERVKPLEAAFYHKLEAKDRLEAQKKINEFFNTGPVPALELLEQKLNDPKMRMVLAFSNEVNEALLLLKNDFLKIITLEIELSAEYIDFFSELNEGTRLPLPEFKKSETIQGKISQFQRLNVSLMAQKNKMEEIKLF